MLKTHLALLYPRDLVVNRQRENARIQHTIDDATRAWGVRVTAFELRRFESGGRDLWRELATPEALTGIRMRAGSLKEEAAAYQLLAAETLVRELEQEGRETGDLKEALERARAASSAGEHGRPTSSRSLWS